MDLAEIEAFVKIAEMGTFTKAAKHLGVSQPAISRRIDLLEVDLGAPVFERLHAGVRLNEAGAAFLPFAQAMLANLRDGIAAVTDVAESSGGTITLAVVGTLASTSLLGRLRSFRERHPDVRLILRTANSNEVSLLVRKGDAHLGLRYFSDDSGSLEEVEVDHERLVIVYATDSRIVPPRASNVSDLASAPWVAFPPGSGSSGEPFAKLLDRHLDRLGFGDSKRIRIDSLTAQKRMIEADFGIGIVPESAVVEELRLGSLQVIDLAGFEEAVPIYLLRRTNGYMSGAMRQLLDILAQPKPGPLSGQ
jgi:DNA-binding transcriptional LysR family regulator